MLGMTLAFETREPRLMERPPRDPRQPLLTFPIFMRTGLVSLLTLCGAFGLFVWENSRGTSLAEARTAVANVIVFVQHLLSFNAARLSVPLGRSAHSRTAGCSQACPRWSSRRSRSPTCRS